MREQIPEEEKKAREEEKKMQEEEGTREEGAAGGKSRKRLFWLALPAVILIGCAAAFVLYENNRVYRECYAEAGVEVMPGDFLKDPEGEAAFAPESDAIDPSWPGEYHVRIKAGYFTHNSTLYITDSIAPQGTPVRVNLELGEECEADAFVKDIVDATRVEVSYGEKPDFAKPGEQKVRLVLTDLGDNRSELEAELYISQVVEELFVEAGSAPPEISDFVIEGEDAKFRTDIASVDYTRPGDKKVSLQVDGVDYQVNMHIVDTVPPALEVKDLESFTLLPRQAEDFVVSAEDVTDVTFSFRQEPDVTLSGEQTVEIIASDQGGNETVKEARLTLQTDEEAPVISGVSDLSVLVGSSISYKKNVTVTDNCPERLSFTVDNSAVNLSVEGVYPITYIARDYAGNETTAEANVTVRPRVYDENEVYAMADAVLARIITPEMSPVDKVHAIYNYNKSHISYLSHSEKGNWVRAAYEGLADGKGDCYVYACTAKALLTRAGIANMDIAKIPSRTSHFWNLVDIGEGWYHFDTTPRKDHPTIIMWSEAQLMEYSAIHYGSHNYDHSLYPQVN